VPEIDLLHQMTEEELILSKNDLNNVACRNIALLSYIERWGLV